MIPSWKGTKHEGSDTLKHIKKSLALKNHDESTTQSTTSKFQKTTTSWASTLKPKIISKASKSNWKSTSPTWSISWHDGKISSDDKPAWKDGAKKGKWVETSTSPMTTKTWKSTWKPKDWKQNQNWWKNNPYHLPPTPPSIDENQKEDSHDKPSDSSDIYPSHFPPTPIPCTGTQPCPTPVPPFPIKIDETSNEDIHDKPLDPRENSEALKNIHRAFQGLLAPSLETLPTDSSSKNYNRLLYIVHEKHNFIVSDVSIQIKSFEFSNQP